MKKIIYLSIIGSILFIVIWGLFPTKARKLNSMWRATLNSQQGFITHESTLQEGDSTSKVFVEYEYETRRDGFYYKRTTYNFEGNGNQKLLTYSSHLKMVENLLLMAVHQKMSPQTFLFPLATI